MKFQGEKNQEIKEIKFQYCKDHSAEVRSAKALFFQITNVAPVALMDFNGHRREFSTERRGRFSASVKVTNSECFCFGKNI